MSTCLRTSSHFSKPFLKSSAGFYTSLRRYSIINSTNNLFHPEPTRRGRSTLNKTSPSQVQPSRNMSSIIDTIKNTIGENFGGVAQTLSTHQFTLDEVPQLDGKVAVVTGGSEGIGYGSTHTLLKHNISKVYIVSVSPEIASSARAELVKDLGESAASRTEWIQCDLSDWPAVVRVASQIRDSTDRLDILINQAARGIMTQQLTDYGVDRHLAVNHFGHVILTSHLMPLLARTAREHSGPVRIVNMASNAHQGAPGDLKFESLDEINKDVGPNGAYGRSKLAAMLYTRWMTRQLEGKGANILVNCTHPGFVSTRASKHDIHEAFPIAGYGMSVGMEPFKKDQFEGCVSSMFAATVTTGCGQYICPPAVPEPGTQQSQDAALADALMKLTREVIIEKTKSQSVDKGCPMDLLKLD